jgi:uncharacterized heparinase superfamily protein
MAEGRFRFLNETRVLAEPADGSGVHQTASSRRSLSIDWDPNAPRLWRFHLQCQEYLLDLAGDHDPALAFGLIDDWLRLERHQFPMRDPDAWHPFCISRRLPVWLSLAALFEPPLSIRVRFWQSIADQVLWLRKNLERDLGGNHLLENLTALVLADAFLDLSVGPKSPILECHLARQFEQQVLPSGEHFERAPTYHGLMMVCGFEAVEALRFKQSEASERLEAVVASMVRFARQIQQPDGRFPLLADSVIDETPEIGKLLSWSADLQLPDTARQARGDWDASEPADYWIAESSGGSRLLFDIGPLACDHLPAHGHADLTQVVATIDGRDAIVDTGNFDYEPSETRQHCRGTAAHNVLQLGNQQHADIWSSFRMGRRGHVLWKSQVQLGDASCCCAAHDAFDRIAGRCLVAEENAWCVIDWFNGKASQSSVDAVTRLHWHPDWSVQLAAGNRFAYANHQDAPDKTVEIHFLGDGVFGEVDDTWYYPNFGVREKNRRLSLCLPEARSGWLGFQIRLRSNVHSQTPVVSICDRRLNLGLASRDAGSGQPTSLTIDLTSGRLE